MQTRFRLTGKILFAIFLLLGVLGAAVPGAGLAQVEINGRLLQETGEPRPSSTDPQYGVAYKRPVLQAACKYCPWGSLGDAVKKAMAPYGYDVAVCYSCSGGIAVRLVAKKAIAPELNDRDFGEGTVFRPEGRIDFGVAGLNRVREAYDGVAGFQRDGPYKNLRTIARIEEMASYLMIAATKESGITSLDQVMAKKMPVRIMAGSGGIDLILQYYGMTAKDIASWGGKILDGNALGKNSNFDMIIGTGYLANNPESNMWYQMSQARDLTFLPVPEGLRDQMVKDGHMVKVDLPFRYMRGVGDKPIPTVSEIEGMVVYGTADLPDQFVRDVAKALDENHTVLKWTLLSNSYDPSIVWNTEDVPLHPAAAQYYRERGYMK